MKVNTIKPSHSSPIILEQSQGIIPEYEQSYKKHHRKYDPSKFTLEHIEKAIEEYCNKKQKPDIEITVTENNMFCKINSEKRVAYTGEGGLRLIVESFDYHLALLTVAWNGTILSQEEKEKLIKHIKDGK